MHCADGEEEKDEVEEEVEEEEVDEDADDAEDDEVAVDELGDDTETATPSFEYRHFSGIIKSKSSSSCSPYRSSRIASPVRQPAHHSNTREATRKTPSNQRRMFQITNMRPLLRVKYQRYAVKEDRVCCAIMQ
jgi:hypothetical protein